MTNHCSLKDDPNSLTLTNTLTLYSSAPIARPSQNQHSISHTLACTLIQFEWERMKDLERKKEEEREIEPYLVRVKLTSIEHLTGSHRLIDSISCMEKVAATVTKPLSLPGKSLSLHCKPLLAPWKLSPPPWKPLPPPSKPVATAFASCHYLNPLPRVWGHLKNGRSRFASKPRPCEALKRIKPNPKLPLVLRLRKNITREFSSNSKIKGCFSANFKGKFKINFL